jgi:hypothetical protein
VGQQKVDSWEESALGEAKKESKCCQSRKVGDESHTDHDDGPGDHAYGDDAMGLKAS